MTESWIDISLRGSHVWFENFILTFFVTMVASLAVSLRSHVQQVQAYVSLLMVMWLLYVFLRHRSCIRTSCVKSISDFYCFQCKGESLLGLVVGKNTRRVFSNYERVNMRPIRDWIVILSWLSWVSYGSLFGEGRREHSENVAIENATGMLGSNLPHVLRAVRLLFLFFIAIASTFRRDDLSWTPRLFGSFFFLLFLPTRESTPQGLSTLEIVSRVCNFCTLFLLSEVHRRTIHYARWVEGYDLKMTTLVAGIQMSLGLARPKTLKKCPRKDPLGATSSDTVPIIGRSFSFVRALADWSPIVESGWVLVSSNNVHTLVFLQSCIVCWSIYSTRTRLCALLDSTSTTTMRRKNNLSVRQEDTLPQKKGCPDQVIDIPEETIQTGMSREEERKLKRRAELAALNIMP